MKTLEIHSHAVLPHHLALADKFGDDTLDSKPPESFYAGCPEVRGYDRAEPGCLLSMSKCVMPHTDTWLGDWNRAPRKQRSFFWLLAGEVTFKVDGFAHILMTPGDWVIFDHRREHMVLADADWLGAAWQLRACRKPPNVPMSRARELTAEARDAVAPRLDGRVKPL